MLLEGKAAIITGGSTGIGRETAFAFAREGARLLIADINVAGGEDVAAGIREQGGEAVFLRTDVTSAADVEAMVAAAVARFGGLDIAFNNAGALGPTATVAELDEADWHAIMALNVTSVFLCMKYQVPAMIARGGGAIVNTSSGMGLFALPRVAGYVASKHAVIGLTKSAAIDFGVDNIRVNALLPGKTMTDLTRQSYERLGRDLDDVAASVPLHRLGLPRDQADAVVWLCSERAAFVTGMSLIVDGGEAALR